MIDIQFWSDEENIELDNAISLEIENAWNDASADPYPEAGDLLTRVYTQ